MADDSMFDDMPVANWSETLGRMRARRDMRALRLDHLSVMVAEAKSRVAKQPKAQEFLERLQERCHQKSVGLYEELLSAVVQDVLPGEKNVALTLKTARGLPSLDIEMIKAGGERESILEGSGGALTNILSAGLRVIALARSGAYPFMVLDEPDCWLKPTLVPQFASVLGQIAEDLGIQMLIISHHDSAAFSRFSSQVKLERRGGELVAKRAGVFDPKEWDGRESGIQELRLFDFMSHKDTIISLAPGVTCLTGENDIGKSAIVLSLRALFYGAASDTAIAHGKHQFKVEALFHDGALLSMERYLKKSPKQRWRYFVPGQTEAAQDSSPKDGAPEWVEHIAKIAKTEDLDIAFANQKSPVFLLDQAPSRRASILAVGRESMHLQKLIAKNKERNLLDARLIRDGESEGASINREIAELSRLDAMTDELLTLKSAYSEWSASLQKAKVLEAAIEKSRTVTALISDSAHLSRSALQAPEIEPTQFLDASLKKLSRHSEMSLLSLATKHVEPPMLAEFEKLDSMLRRLRGANERSGHELRAPKVNEPDVVETASLMGKMDALRLLAKRAVFEVSSQALEPPALAAMDGLLENGRRLSKLRRLIGAAEILLDKKAPETPRILDTAFLQQRLEAAQEAHQFLSAAPEKMQDIGLKEAELSAKRAALFDSVGGACPTCGSSLIEDGRHQEVVHE